MKIINTDFSDYHIHSSNFSDGINTIDEIVKYAGKLGYREIAITDHSDIMVKKLSEMFGFFPNCARYTIKFWKNVFNDINVIFGVEADLLNEDGDICTTIQGIENDFIIVSAHSNTYQSNPGTVTKGLINAIKKHHKKIKFIGHPYDSFQFDGYPNIEELVNTANEYNIPLELNGYALMGGKYHKETLNYILNNINEIYINSDAHSLAQLEEGRIFCYNYLKENNFI